MKQISMLFRVGTFMLLLTWSCHSSTAQTVVISWQAFTRGFANGQSGNVAVTSAVAQTFVGSSESGALEEDLGFLSDPLLRGVITGVNHSDELPLAFSLNQNYPNPFNPSTTIIYQLPTTSYVTIKIFDILGREVETLTDGLQPAGIHNLQWDGKNHASGVYCYRLQARPTEGGQARDFTATKKLMLLR
jgi:hypothetical protein